MRYNSCTNFYKYYTANAYGRKICTRVRRKTSCLCRKYSKSTIFNTGFILYEDDPVRAIVESAQMKYIHDEIKEFSILAVNGTEADFDSFFSSCGLTTTRR
jgi:hypothetical protein